MKREVGIFIGKQTTASPQFCDYTFILRSNGPTLTAQIQLIANGTITNYLDYVHQGNNYNEVSQVLSLLSNTTYLIYWYNPGWDMYNVGLQIIDGSGNLVYELPFGSSWIGQQQLYYLSPSCGIVGVLDYFKLELFNDEKISVSPTIQNITDISKFLRTFRKVLQFLVHLTIIEYFSIFTKTTLTQLLITKIDTRHT